MQKILLIAALASALWCGQATAHARLMRAAPRVGATVARSPDELRLEFSETIDLPRSRIALKGPGGAPIGLGALRLKANDPRVVLAPVMAALASGAYRVEWSMTAADAHQTEGDFRFTVKP